MAKISVKRFVELLQKSDLVPDLVLREALTQIKKENDNQPLADTDFVTRRLIEMDLVTPWQCDKLMSQKYKGFFLGKYKILGHIGTGGMSSVYLVEHLQMHQRRAIKVLPRKRVTDKTYLERFYIEARASASLDHPNIVRALDVDHDEDSDTHYLIMEYVDGRDLGKIIEEDGPIAPREAAAYVAQAAEALQFAHDQGVVHRDVKPGNVLVDRNNEVKILDMGLALFKEDEYSLTLEYNEKILGTADYLAPEQAMNSHDVDHRADIYGLGCTLYFMLTGQPPFNKGTLAQRIVMHQTRQPPAVRKLCPECPEELQQILTHMMEKDPDKRFQTCRDVARVTTQWLAGKPVVIPRPIPVGGPSPSGSGTPQTNSDVLESDPPATGQESERHDPPNHESVKTSADETFRKSSQSSARGTSRSSSHSKIQLSAVSFSDIVAGSEVVSAEPTVAAGTAAVQASTQRPETGVAGNAGRKEDGAKNNIAQSGSLLEAGDDSSSPQKTIEMTPVFLIVMVLFCVFASSAFTILVLDWLGILGRY